jgi:hypothetical protein
MAMELIDSSMQNDIGDKDRREMERLMNEQVLETANYPEIVYDVPIFMATRWEIPSTPLL